MNKFLLLGFTLLAGGAIAQTYPAQRINYGQYQADIQPTIIDDNHAVINVQNPNGPESFRMNVEGTDNRINMVARDQDGRVIGMVDGVREQYVNSMTDVNGVRQEMRLKQLGDDDITGTINYTNKNTGEEISANLLGGGMGLLNQQKQGYKMALNIRGEDSMSVTYTKASTNEVICIVEDNNGRAKVYNAAHQLVAEGMTDDDAPSKIYNEAAYKNCEKVMEIFSDDDDE